MSKINTQWHLSHKMPKNPTLDERIRWHAEHFSQCQCRKMPSGIYQSALEKGLVKK